MPDPKRRTPELTSLGGPRPEGGGLQLSEYNYEHFRPKHLLADVWKTIRGEGLQPGAQAPDFEMETTEGGQIRLSGLRGKPVVLRFGSFT